MRVCLIAVMLLFFCCGCERHSLSLDERACLRVGVLTDALKTNVTIRAIQLSGTLRECLNEVGDSKKRKKLIFDWRDALFNVAVDGLNVENRFGVIKESATLLDWDVVCAMHDAGCSVDEVWSLRFRIVDWLDDHIARMRKLCDKRELDYRGRHAAWMFYQALAEYREQLVENFERFYLDDRDFRRNEEQLGCLRQKLSAKIGRAVRCPSEIKKIGVYVRQVRDQIRQERACQGGCGGKALK